LHSNHNVSTWPDGVQGPLWRILRRIQRARAARRTRLTTLHTKIGLAKVVVDPSSRPRSLSSKCPLLAQEPHGRAELRPSAHGSARTNPPAPGRRVGDDEVGSGVAGGLLHGHQPSGPWCDTGPAPSAEMPAVPSWPSRVRRKPTRDAPLASSATIRPVEVNRSTMNRLTSRSEAATPVVSNSPGDVAASHHERNRPSWSSFVRPTAGVLPRGPERSEGPVRSTALVGLRPLDKLSPSA